jgi:VanZ family protein
MNYRSRMTDRARRAGLWLPPVAYMMIIFGLSAQSKPLPVLTEHVWDKLLHTTEYAGLGLLFCRALVGEGFGWLAAALVAVLAASLYGASDEWHQYYVPMRSADVHDWIADKIGAAIGTVAYVAAIGYGRMGRRT